MLIACENLIPYLIGKFNKFCTVKYSIFRYSCPGRRENDFHISICTVSPCCSFVCNGSRCSRCLRYPPKLGSIQKTALDWFRSLVCLSICSGYIKLSRSLSDYLSLALENCIRSERSRGAKENKRQRTKICLLANEISFALLLFSLFVICPTTVSYNP